MPKEIQLTQGKVAIVDDEDYEYLSQFKWYAAKNQKCFYAQRNVGLTNGKQTTLKMHHVIIGKPPMGFVTDHRDGNGLHNWRDNLRHVTPRQNTQNIKNINLTSQFPGVFWSKENKKWCAQISVKEKRTHLGYFTDELEAAKAYEAALNEIREVIIDN